MMRRLSHRTVTLTASALSALVLAFPARGYAGHYDNDDWNSSAWQGVQHEREELDQARDNQREDWRRLQHERREMDEARQAGNWGAYQHERREAQEAENALARDQGQVEHERQELRQQRRALRHHHHEWNED